MTLTLSLTLTLNLTLALNLTLTLPLSERFARALLNVKDIQPQIAVVTNT